MRVTHDQQPDNCISETKWVMATSVYVYCLFCEIYAYFVMRIDVHFATESPVIVVASVCPCPHVAVEFAVKEFPRRILVHSI